MQLHRSEGATRPPVSPTAWLTSWVGLEDSDTATLYRPMWGPRRLAVGSDTAQCERHTRCVYIATIRLIITLQPHSFAKRNWLFFFVLSRSRTSAPHGVTQWNPYKESIEPRVYHHKHWQIIFWWLPESRHYLLFICASEKWNNYN